MEPPEAAEPGKGAELCIELNAAHWDYLVQLIGDAAEKLMDENSTVDADQLRKEVVGRLFADEDTVKARWGLLNELTKAALWEWHERMEGDEE